MSHVVAALQSLKGDVLLVETRVQVNEYVQLAVLFDALQHFPTVLHKLVLGLRNYLGELDLAVPETVEVGPCGVAAGVA